jgi:hypothetical protein
MTRRRKVYRRQNFLHQPSGEYRRSAKSLGWMIASLAAVLLFNPAARGQEKACCSITAIDARAGLVSAKVNETSQSFQFKPNSPTLLSSMRVGEGVYANFSTRQVSLDGKTICCTIVGMDPAPQPQAPVAKPPSSPQPSQSPKPPSPSKPNALPPSIPAPPTSGTNPACCVVTSANAPARLVTAKENSNGQGFEFSAPNSLPIENLHPGQPVWANFKARKVSLDGHTACCDIVSLVATGAAPSAQPNTPSASASSSTQRATPAGANSDTGTTPEKAIVSSPSTSVRNTLPGPITNSGAGATTPNQGAAPLAFISSVTCSNSVASGAPIHCKVTSLAGQIPVTSSDNHVAFFPGGTLTVSSAIGGTTSFDVLTIGIAEPASVIVTLTGSNGSIPSTVILQPAAIENFGCSSASVIDSSTPLQSSCKFSVGSPSGVIAVRLTAPAPAAGLSIPLKFPAGSVSSNTPASISVPGNSDSGYLSIPFSNSSAPQSLTVAAVDPLTGTESSTVLQTVAPHIVSFGCSTASAIDRSTPTQNQCQVVTGSSGTATVIAHLDMPVGPAGNSLSLQFPGANFATGTPNTIPIQGNTDWGFLPMTFGNTLVAQAAPVSAIDPATGTKSSTQLALVPPQPQTISFLDANNTVITSISGVPVGGQSFTVSVALNGQTPQSGMSVPAQYSGPPQAGSNNATTAVLGPSQIQVAGLAKQFSFNVKVNPCDPDVVTPPCRATVTIGGVTASLLVNP